VVDGAGRRWSQAFSYETALVAIEEVTSNWVINVVDGLYNDARLIRNAIGVEAAAAGGTTSGAPLLLYYVSRRARAWLLRLCGGAKDRGCHRLFDSGGSDE
jgi:hypothetical protein